MRQWRWSLQRTSSWAPCSEAVPISCVLLPELMQWAVAGVWAQRSSTSCSVLQEELGGGSSPTVTSRVDSFGAVTSMMLAL